MKILIAINFCANQPCLNGGTCESLAEGYSCNCSAGYMGEKCEYGNCILFQLKSIKLRYNNYVLVL